MWLAWQGCPKTLYMLPSSVPAASPNPGHGASPLTEPLPHPYLYHGYGSMQEEPLPTYEKRERDDGDLPPAMIHPKKLSVSNRNCQPTTPLQVFSMSRCFTFWYFYPHYRFVLPSYE